MPDLEGARLEGNMAASRISIWHASVARVAAVAILTVSYFALPVRAEAQLNRLFIDAGACLQQPPGKMSRCARDIGSRTQQAYEKDYDPSRRHSTQIPQRLLQLNAAANYHETDQFLQDKLQKAKAWESKSEFYAKYEQEHGKSDAPENDAPDGERTSRANSAPGSALSVQAPPLTTGAEPSVLDNKCVVRDPEPWQIYGDKKTVAVLKLRNICAKPLSVSFCFKSPGDQCWKCTQIALDPGQSATSMDLIPGCTMPNCSEVHALYNVARKNLT